MTFALRIPEAASASHSLRETLRHRRTRADCAESTALHSGQLADRPDLATARRETELHVMHAARHLVVVVIIGRTQPASFPDVCVLVMSRANVGWDRACVTASNPEASLISVGSLNAVPMKLMPTGMPSTSPAGTWMIGYPAGPARPELANRK